jgi:cytochrome c oxidase cbb3-type subunit 3
MSDDQQKTTGHEYDGIREFDNPLPLWWLSTFIATVIFSFLYWIHYEIAGGRDQLTELKDDMALIESQRPAAPAETEDELRKLLSDGGLTAKGKQVFLDKCAVCHGGELQGLIGPNLTDEYWLHGGKLTEIATTVRKGVPAKGMPPWETMLKDDEVKSVTAFIGSRRGSHPPNAKAPQGEKVAYD